MYLAESGLATLPDVSESRGTLTEDCDLKG